MFLFLSLSLSIYVYIYIVLSLYLSLSLSSISLSIFLSLSLYISMYMYDRTLLMTLGSFGTFVLHGYHLLCCPESKLSLRHLSERHSVTESHGLLFLDLGVSYSVC